MTKFRPCVDLHEGKVKQIVGKTLDSKALQTNFISKETPQFFAKLYKSYKLSGGHVIKLGKGNDDAALEAIHAWPNNLQVGGGINIDNADYWIDQGASKVIVTSWLFPQAKFEIDRLRRLVEKIGTENLVLDLSCRALSDQWVVAIDKWQTMTEFFVNEGLFYLIKKTWETCQSIVLNFLFMLQT
jgi:phosphoribosylformimino-5-aminoimidazole carboxamide ribotide isomerase